MKGAQSKVKWRPTIHTIAPQGPPPIVTPLAYDAILTDIYDFIRFKLTIIPRFILEPWASAGRGKEVGGRIPPPPGFKPPPLH